MRLPVAPPAPSSNSSSSSNLRARDLEGWKLLDRFDALLEEITGQVPLNPREDHGLRTFGRRHYFGLFLLGLFNPVVESMSGPLRGHPGG
jgi:hypothetical protein